MENKIYDVTIIGGGPAGLTAAIYAGRANKTVALVEKESFGGNIARSPRVENIPGFVSISGADFAMNMYDQVAALPTVETVIDEVKMIAYKPGLFIVVLDSGEQILSKTVIVATGTKHKELKLQTKDIYYCWFGRNAKSKEMQRCIKSWKKFLPDYCVHEINEDNYDLRHKPAYVQQAYDAKKWAFVSDYARFDVLYHRGGYILIQMFKLFARLRKSLRKDLIWGAKEMVME